MENQSSIAKDPDNEDKIESLQSEWKGMFLKQFSVDQNLLSKSY